MDNHKEATEQLVDVLIEKTQNISLVWKKRNPVIYGDVQVLVSRFGSCTYYVSKMYSDLTRRVFHNVTMSTEDGPVIRLFASRGKEELLWASADAQFASEIERTCREQEARDRAKKIEEIEAFTQAAEELKSL